MGQSVESQCDKTKYFSISTIDKNQMREHGLDMTIKQLQDKARHAVPVAEIFTGKITGRQRKTKIYCYDDFKEET